MDFSENSNENSTIKNTEQNTTAAQTPNTQNEQTAPNENYGYQNPYTSTPSGTAQSGYGTQGGFTQNTQNGYGAQGGFTQNTQNGYGAQGGFTQNTQNGYGAQGGFTQNTQSGYGAQGGFTQNGYGTQNKNPYSANGDYSTSPSQIYNNSRESTSQPQYHYGRPIPMMDNRYFYEQQQRIAARRDLKKALRHSARFPSVSLGFFLVIGSVFSAVLALSPLYESYFTSSFVCSAVSIFYSVFAVTLPFYLAWLIFRGKKRLSDIPLGPSRLSPGRTALLIFGCFGGCLIANYVTNIIAVFFEAFGMELTYSTGPDPQNLTEILLSFLATAVIPPLVEELVMRGMVLGHLKKYGNGFAVLASAFVFAIFHGTPTQIPFAFICGLFLGYAACATGTLWTGIIIHALVNSLSCLYSAANLYLGAEVADSVTAVITMLLLLAGIVCGIIYLALYKKTDTTLKNTPFPELSVWEKFKSFLSNPLMIIATVYFLLTAALQINFID